jgi:transcriptional regulator
MYLPAHFEELRREVLQRLIEEHPLGTLVTFGADGLDANHLPFAIDPEPAPLGTLRGHLARANPQWRSFAPEVDALVVFQGPGAYVSPALYPSKRETAKVVPTWNYVVVHARGPLRIVEDPESLRALVERLTDRHERERADPWKVTDAPADFIDKMLRAIVGLEIPLRSLAGKWKLGQNRPPADRDAVAQAMGREPARRPTSLAEWMNESD